jgi:hypothetical protein
MYAMYRGDEFLDVGTAYQLAERHGCKVESILFKASRTYHRRTGEKAVKVYRIEDDEQQSGKKGTGQ